MTAVGSPESVRSEAGRLTNEGVAALERGDLRIATELLERATRADPGSHLPWFDLGLAYKRGREWQRGFEAFVAARARVPANVSAELLASVLWNIAITGSIVEAWPEVWRAYREIGHPLGAPSARPPSIPMGKTWLIGSSGVPALGQRLDPVRAKVIRDPPEPADLSAGAIVVHDGSRVDTREFRGRELPVFPVLVVVGDS